MTQSMVHGEQEGIGSLADTIKGTKADNFAGKWSMIL